jgi:hypothetical protein
MTISAERIHYPLSKASGLPPQTLIWARQYGKKNCTWLGPTQWAHYLPAIHNPSSIALLPSKLDAIKRTYGPFPIDQSYPDLM